MRYVMVAALLAGVAGCAWFDRDDDDRRTSRVERADRVDGRDGVVARDGVRVGFTRDEVNDDPTGDTAIDPVSGEVVRQDRALRMHWKGLTYYFDSEDNMEAFEDNPENYVTREGYLKKSLDESRREAEVR